MIIWLNGCFGVGKTETANRLHSLLENSHIYDPEQVGYFLWDNFPDTLKRKGDFQDIEIWRSLNYQIIKYMYQNYDGHIIIPMTIVNAEYYNQIIGKLQRDGIEIKHFILYAPKETIVDRLMGRGEGSDSWAEQQIDRCMNAYRSEITGEMIDTSKLSVEGVADYILSKTVAKPF